MESAPFDTHILSGLAGSILSIVPLWIWFRKQLIELRKENQKLRAGQLDLDRKQADNEQAKDKAVSAGWQELFDRCEQRAREDSARRDAKEEAFQKQIDSLSQKVIDLNRENAGQQAEIQVLRAEINALKTFKS